MRALQRLEQAHHPAVPRLIRPVLQDSDPMIAAAAIRTLGDMGDEWAIDVLLDLLRRGEGQSSRIAAELERLAPAPGARLLPLLDDRNPSVRFWGATLLRPYPELGEAPSSGSRGTPTRTCAPPQSRRSEREAERRSAQLLSRAWTTASGSSASTRHELRATSSELRPRRPSSGSSPTSAGGCARRPRTLFAGWASTPFRRCSRSSVHDDAFARNGAAEVLQDIGFVDFLALDNPRSPLLERIYEAGGERYRIAAEARLEAIPDEDVRAA